ncbi:MAG: hypothetical protein ACLFPS_09115 [Clostridia bacterium]
MEITKEDVKQVIKYANENVGEYATPIYPLQDAIREVLGEEGLDEYKHIKTERYEPHRWFIPTDEIMKLGDFYICGAFNDPSTEGQVGQPTDVRYYEVEPVEKTIVIYIKKEQE